MSTPLTPLMRNIVCFGHYESSESEPQLKTKTNELKEAEMLLGAEGNCRVE